MADDFDPYYTWLGIPPEEQPATHYRLLGVRPFEPSLDVISNAGDQRMAFLRTFQVGKRSALSQQLLNEMAAAKGCLLDPDRRKAYDAKLRGSQPKPAPPHMSPKPFDAAPAYTPPATVLVPSRQVPVARPLPMAARVPSTSPDPFVPVDPFADVARQVNSQPVLPVKPPANESPDYADQLMTAVRAVLSRAQESPLATAAYGVLALGVVMLLSVGLWIAVGTRNPIAVAGAASVPGAVNPNLPSKTSSPTAPKVAEQESPKPAAKPESAPPSPGEASKTLPDTRPPVPPVETVPEKPAEPKSSSPVISVPNEILPSEAPEPASARATAIYNVLPGTFPRPRIVRLSPGAASVADVAPGGKVVRVWATSPAKKLPGPLAFLGMPSNVRSLRFSSNERVLAIGTEDSVGIWDLPARKNLQVALPGPGIDVVFCDNDRLVAVTSEGAKTVRLIEVSTGAVLHTFQLKDEEIRSLATGEQWLAALGANGQIALFDVRQMIHHGNLVPRPELPLTAVHMRGKEIFAFDSRCLTGWSAQELKQLSEGSHTRTTPVPDAFDVHSGHFTQQANGKLSLFKWTNNEAPLAQISPPGGKFDVVDIAADRMLTIGDDSQLLIWNLERVKEAKGTIVPADAIAVWSGAKPALTVVSTEKPTLPTPSPASSDGPLETVDPATALEALRGLGVQQLPSTPGEVQSLNFTNTRATDSDAKYVLAFPRLQGLMCDRTQFSGQALRYFQKVPALRFLSLSGCSQITDDDLQVLGKFSNLDSLSLSETGVTAAGVAHLQGLAKLTSLNLPRNLGREAVPTLSRMENLRYLSPLPQGLTDDDLGKLSQLSHLQLLDLQPVKLSVEGYRHLEKFKEVSTILLSSNCPREAFPYLKNMKLQHFSLPASARDEDVEIFAAMPTLKGLFLNNNMTDQSLATLSKFPQLEHVGFGSCKLITDGGLSPLRQLKSLKELTLHNSAGDEALRVVAQIPSLQQLHLAGDSGSITDAGIEALSALHNLSTLSLPHKTSDRSCEVAGKMKELQVLAVYGKNITPDGLRKLVALPKLSMLRIEKKLSAKDAAVLRELKSVNLLTLDRTGLSDEAIAELRKALPGVQIHVSN